MGKARSGARIGGRAAEIIEEHRAPFGTRCFSPHKKKSPRIEYRGGDALLLIGKILCSVLAVFGLYVLLRRLLATEGEIALAVKRRSGAEREQLLKLLKRARDDAWLCGNRRVLLLDEDAREITVTEFLK